MSTATRITIADYEQMIERGEFDGPNQKRIELIHGELRDMSPIGEDHQDIVDWLLEWSFDVADLKRVRIRCQGSVGVPEFDSVPQPDLVWMHRRKKRGRPKAKDVDLLIEVADSSLRYDLGEKARLYASTSVIDYWVVDIPNRTVHVHRDPVDGEFRTKDTFSAKDVVTPSRNADVSLAVADLFACLDG